MKTALIYCGGARTISQIWENHRWYLRHLPSPDIFVSVADNAEADDMLLLKQAFPAAAFHMEKVKQPDIPEPVELTRFRSGYPRSTSLQGVLKQLWAMNRAWEFFEEVNRKLADAQKMVWFNQYDLIVRVRPDTAFVRCEMPWSAYSADNKKPENLRAALDYDLRGQLHRTCWSPWWSKFGGINDRFAILGQVAARAYFTTFQKREKLWDLGCPRHPEQMMKASLEMDGIEPNDTLLAEFVTVRLPDKEHPNGGYFPVDITNTDIVDLARKKP